MFKIDVDAARALMSAEIAGFWTAKELAAFTARHREAEKILGTAASRSFSLINAADFPVQSREVAEGIQAMVANAAFGEDHFAAVIVGSALSRMQSQRVSSDERNRHFATKAEALDWLEAMGLPRDDGGASTSPA